MPPRIHVLMRAGSSRAVVVWRGPGPKRLVCTLHWDLATDSFARGQGPMAAVMDGRDCDLGPRGEWMVYAVASYPRPADKTSYVALSRPPFLNPVELRRTWSPVQLWTRDEANAARSFLNVSTLPSLPDHLVIAHCSYTERLQRDGWVLVREDLPCRPEPHWGRPGRAEPPPQRANVFQKRFQSVTVEKWVRGDWWYPSLGPTRHVWESHWLVDGRGDAREHLDWEWAEVHGSTLYWASQGALYATDRVESDGSVPAPRLVQDLNRLGHLRAYVA